MRAHTGALLAQRSRFEPPARDQARVRTLLTVPIGASGEARHQEGGIGMRVTGKRLHKVLVLALLTTCVLGVTATQAFALTEVELAGPTRFETAVEISKAGWPTGSDGVVIATGMNWPDALGGAVLCGYDMYDCPILLVRPDSIPAAVWDEIERLSPTEAVILGGTKAVDASVEARLDSLLGAAHVQRVYGPDRYQTSLQIARHAIDINNSVGAPYDGGAYVATGGNFPDSLAVSPMSLSGMWPIFLANPHQDTVPTTAMRALDVQFVFIIGGPSVVSPAQEAALIAEFGASNVERIYGSDRYATAANLAEYGHLNWFRNLDWCSFATGENFPDALAGGALCGKWNTVLFITPGDRLPSSVVNTLTTYKTSITERVNYLGETDVLSQNVRNQVRSILQ